MPQLRELSLSHTARMEASPAAFRQLAAALTQLTALDVSFCPLLFNTEEEEAAAAAAAGEGPKGDLVMQMQQLRSLKVCRTSSSLLDFAAISQATALTHLAAGGDRDDDPGHWFTQTPDTQHLPLMQRLRRLELSSCSFDSLAAAAVAKLTQLTSINYSNSIVSLGVIEALGSCSGLIELNLCTLQSGFRGRAPGPAVAAAWAHLSLLTALTMLNVSGRGCNANFSAGLLVPLARACGSRLRVLLLDACAKQPGELAVLLPACTGLAALDLSHSGCRFSTDHLSALAGLSRLEWLQLQHCKPMLRGDAVAALVQLRQLQQLDLRDNDLSLAGTRALLVALAGAGGQLTELRMGGNFDVTGRAKAQLAREFVHVAL
uniref:F-box domain-containing protein n=1 Tax=Tetradesmus obliquus TaxID=3088 RepID=A0A383WJ28_TETOB|eukprot:jgi/Sobl393_1/17866/SZX77421.1